MTSLGRVREAIQAPRRTGFVAERAEGEILSVPKKFFSVCVNAAVAEASPKGDQEMAA